MHMRSVALLIVLLLLSLVTLTPMTGVAQAIDQPQYAVGDFWVYDLLLPEIAVPPEFEEILAALDIGANLTVTVAALEDITINGTTYPAYEMDQVLAIGVDGMVPFPIDENTTANATVAASVSVDAQVYLAQQGLELLQVNGTLDVDLSVGAEVEGIMVTLPVTVTGTVDVAVEYVSDDWTFPLEVGNQGSEEFKATGASQITMEAFGNTTESSTNISANGTVSHEVEREASMTVEAGTFSTLVVKSTVAPENVTLPEDGGYALAYWSGEVGAPVRLEVWNDTAINLALNLTAYSYQAAQRFTIFGIEAIIFIPIIVAIGVAVAVIVIYLMRRR